MANTLYDLGRKAFLDADIDWLVDDIKIMLVDVGYVVNLATDQFQSDVLVGNRVDTSANLASKTSTDGIADGADITFTAVTGNQVTQLVIFRDSGVEGTSALIANIDTATGLPVTPNGGDITIQWDAGINLIFKL